MASDHAHHGSAPSCVACHMPKTSYALRYAIRSHRIDSPSASSDRPSACNLCHLDRSSAWTARETARLWGKSPAGSGSDLPASIVGLLRADAAERVLWADAFGDCEAITASGNDWEAPVIAKATQDPYAVIRYVAERSSRAYPAATRTLVSPEAIEALVRQRNDRPVSIAE
jgi:hypothetical protein